MSTHITGKPGAAFLLVWLPSLAVIIASGGCLFALSWWVSQTPGGGADLGVLIGCSSVVSLVTLTAMAGALDRADRRESLVRLLLLMLLPVSVLIVVFGGAPGGAAVVVAGVCYMVISTAETLYLATNETVTADLAPASWPSARTAVLIQLHSPVERVIAPMLAGLLIAAGAIRSVPSAAVGVIACVLAVVHAARRHLDRVTRGSAASRDRVRGLTGVVRDARSAGRLIRSHRDLKFLLWLAVLSNLIVVPFYAVLPAYLGEYTSDPHDLALWFGRAAGAYGIGMLIGTVALVRLRRKVDGERALLAASASLALICMTLVAAATSSAPAVVVAVMAVNGALATVGIAVTGAVWLARTAARVRVRVFALRRLISFSSIPVGTMLIGFGGAVVGYRSFVRMLAVIVLVVLFVAWLRYRATRPAVLNHLEGS